MKNRITQYKISNLPFKEQSGEKASFPQLIILKDRTVYHAISVFIMTKDSVTKDAQCSLFLDHRSKNNFVF